MSARNRELIALAPASILLIIGFSSIFAQSTDTYSKESLTFGGVFFGLCLLVHVAIRIFLPSADPYMFPLVAVLACFGLVIIYRVDESLARAQAQWFVIGLICFIVTIITCRGLKNLESLRYTIAIVGIGLLLAPRLPVIGEQVNGAYLGVKIGPISFQPAEFGKIAIVIFMASYLKDNGPLLVSGAKRIFGITIPRLKYFGPLAIIWGAAMLMLIFIRDLGSSLMYFGAFMALTYIATNRASFVVVGMSTFALGAWYLGTHIPHVQQRVEIWLNPFKPSLVDNTSYQLVQSLFAQAEGGLFGTGLGHSMLRLPNGNPILPLAETDLVYSVIVSDLGLVGAIGLLLVFLLFIARAFSTAILARDAFASLLAAGLASVFALQIFVIVGGVTRVIPLTGVTLPFVSYGGSSIVANCVLLALLLIVSNQARTPRKAVTV